MGLFEETGPVFDGCYQGARVDVVEFIVEDPFFFAIVD